jgi:hypothetical protein
MVRTSMGVARGQLGQRGPSVVRRVQSFLVNGEDCVPGLSDTEKIWSPERCRAASDPNNLFRVYLLCITLAQQET